MPDGLRRSRFSLLALLLALIAMRSSSFFCDLIDPDEAHFLLIAKMLLHGALPYVDAVDKKPLLTYLLFTPAALLGWSMMPMKILGVLWVLATSWVLRRAATLWSGRADVGSAAAWLYAMISSCNNLCIHSELLMNLPLAGALVFFLRARKSEQLADDAWMGLCIGLASMFRHQAGIVLVALAPVVLFHRIGMARALLRLSIVSFAFIAPWAVAAAIYAKLGHLNAFLDWNLVRNFAYVTTAGTEGVLPRFARSVLLFVLLSAPLPWLFALRAGLRRTEALRTDALRTDAVRNALLLCLLLTWIPVAMSGRFYSVYFVQFAVPLAMLAAPETAALWARWPALPFARRMLWVAGFAIPILVYGVSGYYRLFSTDFPYPSQEPVDVALARAIRQQTLPTDRIFVWGYVPPLYTLAQRLPGTRYITTAVHLGDIEPYNLTADFDPSRSLSSRDIEATISDLDRNRPALIIDTAGANIHRWQPFPLAVVPALHRYITAHYDLLPERPQGAQLYRVRTRR